MVWGGGLTHPRDTAYRTHPVLGMIRTGGPDVGAFKNRTSLRPPVSVYCY